jgi:xylulose-5-phosphate/fructose-6-phosphate phosphoketolase
VSQADASDHCARGASIWPWASSEAGVEPDVVLAAAGDIPTMETLAAADWLRRNVPEMKVRVVNVVDLMSLFPIEHHPHGMPEPAFVSLFTADKPVVFAFHGYQRAIHEVIHGRPNTDRFHVRGFSEQGTTTTPFDMVVLNGMSRYHLAMLALKESPRLAPQAPRFIAALRSLIGDAIAYSREHFEDPPEIREWSWKA